MAPCHTTNPVRASRGNFGIKYEGKKHLEHLTTTIRAAGYSVEVDEAGSLYYGLTLKWNYEQRYVNISVPGYVKEILAHDSNITTQRDHSTAHTSLRCASTGKNAKKHSLKTPPRRLTLSKSRQSSWWWVEYYIKQELLIARY